MPGLCCHQYAACVEQPFGLTPQNLSSQVEAIKAEMRECVSRVTRGRALLDLAAVFQVRPARLVGM